MPLLWRSRSPVRQLCSCNPIRYEHLGRLASGGMAEIHLGRIACCSNHKTIAMKTMRKRFTTKDVVGFLHECRLSLAIDHPNVAAAYEAGRDTGGYFLAMEAVEGTDLRAIQRWTYDRGARLPPFLTAYLISKVAAGLHAVHELADRNGRLLQVVHGDVSPQNVLVSWSGEVKLCDFGVAHSILLERAQESISGKPRYLSPEQCRLMHLDRRTDVFSLGLVLFELLSGQTLFADLDRRRATDVRRFVFPRLRALAPQVDAELEAIAMTAVELDRDHRYQTARAFHLALESWMQQTHPFADGRREAEHWMQVHLRRSRVQDPLPLHTFTEVTVLEPETLPPPPLPMVVSRAHP